MIPREKTSGRGAVTAAGGLWPNTSGGKASARARADSSEQLGRQAVLYKVQCYTHESDTAILEPAGEEEPEEKLRTGRQRQSAETQRSAYQRGESRSEQPRTW